MKFHYRVQKPRYWSHSWTTLIQNIPTPSNCSKIRLIILSSHLRLGLPSVLFPSWLSHQNPVWIILLSHACYMQCQFVPVSLTIPAKRTFTTLFIMPFSPASSHFALLGSKYSQHLVFQHPQSTIFPQCRRKNSTLIQHQLRQNNGRLFCRIRIRSSVHWANVLAGRLPGASVSLTHMLSWHYSTPLQGNLIPNHCLRRRFIISFIDATAIAQFIH